MNFNLGVFTASTLTIIMGFTICSTPILLVRLVGVGFIAIGSLFFMLEGFVGMWKLDEKVIQKGDKK